MKLSLIQCEPITDIGELDRRMAQLASLGYHGIELTVKHPLPYSTEEILTLTHKHHLPVVSLLSGWSYANENLCLASPHDDVRRRAVDRLIEYAGHAARLKAVLVVGLMQGLRSDEPDGAQANQRIENSLRQVAKAAEQLGTTVVLEPVNHLQVGFNHTAAEAAAMVKRVGSPALSYMLDTIHMNIEERSMWETIRTHGRHIKHFHLCETNGGPFGTGSLDFPRVLATLTESGYSSFVSIKIYRHADWKEAAQGAIEFLRERTALAAGVLSGNRAQNTGG